MISDDDDLIVDNGPVNVPLLRKVVEWAEAEAENARRGSLSQWYQGDYIMETGCGTAYCIAGWTLHEAGYTDEEIKQMSTNGKAPAKAAELLGIEFNRGYGDGHRLFFGSNSIEKVRILAEEAAGEKL